jgi:thiosulfate/3-mercaptopyruvate sulfurtransferase
VEKRILMTAEELQSKLAEPGWIAVDCRFELADPEAGRAAFEAGHIPGAVYLDLEADLSGPIGAGTGRHPLPDPQHLQQALGAVGISNEHNVVVYDDARGGVAARAWWLLHWLGHDAVWLLDGGMARWRALELPVEVRVRPRAPARFTGQPRGELVLTTAELSSNMDGIAALNLLDARDAARFRGEHEPIDPVAGHIPGAISAPFADFVAADGTWLDLEERRRRLLSALGEDNDAEWCVMCGSGVTACHLAISGLEAGLREPRVYIGSWSEWIRDQGRPVGRTDR